MTDRELTRKWLWMQGMDFGCYLFSRRAISVDVEGLNWQEELQARYEYVLANWEKALREVKLGHTARLRGYGEYDTGYSDYVRHTGIESTYKNITVLVTWAEIKAFIQEMLNPDNQLDMFDLLLQGASHD